MLVSRAESKAGGRGKIRCLTPSGRALVLARLADANDADHDGYLKFL
ncbi:MAG: hypothetical protein WAK98_05435 [Gemmobacter sp.]